MVFLTSLQSIIPIVLLILLGCITSPTYFRYMEFTIWHVGGCPNICYRIYRSVYYDENVESS